MMNQTLTVTDNRTQQTYELPITDGTVRARDFRQMKTSEGDFGLMVYDPGFANTASCRSGITHVDGESSILAYRGYPIEELAERSSYLETAYLLIHGELPTKPQSRSSPALTRFTNSGTRLLSPIAVNILITASLAPPCRGP